MSDALAYWQTHLSDGQMWAAGFAVLYFSGLIYQQWRKRNRH